MVIQIAGPVTGIPSLSAVGGERRVTSATHVEGMTTRGQAKRVNDAVNVEQDPNTP